MFKLIKISLIIAWSLMIIYLSVNSFVDGYYFEQYMYWLVLIGLLYFIWQFKQNSGFALYFSFILFIISAIIVSLGFKSVGEFVMRLSFILLLTGYVQSLIESIS